MRFSWFGGMIQSGANTEGDVLCRAGYLVEVRERGRVIGFDPTDKLRELFPPSPDLDLLYPLLVEMVCHYRHPAIVDFAQLCRKLAMLGLTKDGLDRLQRRLSEIVGPPR